MVCLAATLGLVIFSGIMDLSAANKDPCDLYAVVGQSLTLPFVFEGLGVHELRWTHNTTIIFRGQQGRVSHGKAEDISKTGSLFLKNLQFSSAGIYQADVVNPNRTLATTWNGSLCVMDKVAKPQLTYICVKTSAVILNCNVANPQGLTFSWTLDDKTLINETKQTLRISLAQQKVVRSFTCSVANKVSKEKSDIVRPTCESPPPPPLFCLKSQTVLAVLAGGAGLILFLLVIIIILCCRYRRIKTQMRRRDQEGLRMPSLNKLEPNISPDYETMHQTEDAPTVSQTSLPKDCYENVTQPEAQTENKPAQLSADAEGQKPSPVPKPRTKSPKTPNI
ncbi:hypothetical protein OYC64_009431 [Pagothenia borchgrevinki]|uniref:Ig-like domain-containing protein n=1 Tax=Pagothenia borchgrevinki TaxID=8213 RepID=A0ABD2H5K4_PAGBO